MGGTKEGVILRRPGVFGWGGQDPEREEGKGIQKKEGWVRRKRGGESTGGS